MSRDADTVELTGLDRILLVIVLDTVLRIYAELGMDEHLGDDGAAALKGLRDKLRATL